MAEFNQIAGSALLSEIKGLKQVYLTALKRLV